MITAAALVLLALSQAVSFTFIYRLSQRITWEVNTLTETASTIEARKEQGDTMVTQ